jgi:hypothetical protein
MYARPARRTIPDMTERSVIAIRRAAADEDGALRRLAELDSAAPLHDPVLLALVDGAPVAALSLADDRVVADPFEPTADVVALLRTYAERGAQPRRRRGRRALRLVHAVP